VLELERFQQQSNKQMRKAEFRYTFFPEFFKNFSKFFKNRVFRHKNGGDPTQTCNLGADRVWCNFGFWILDFGLT
jgi:hypothetical protein